MIPVAKHERKELAALFQDYQWNYLAEAVLDGTTGEASVNDLQDPQVAVLELPIHKLFIPGGNADLPAGREFMMSLPKIALLVFGSAGWEGLLNETHPGKTIRLKRFAFSSEKLDREFLANLAAQIPEGYRLERMDLDLAQQLEAEKSSFASDHMANFDSAADFIERGFGFCILAEGEIVCAATTFVVCDKGIEIQISTRKKHRRKGLATVAAARLLVHCLQYGLDPNWDAENERSARLAEKLGYTSQGKYDMWIVVDSKVKALIFRLLLKFQGVI